MSGFTRVSLIIAAGLAGIGLLICIAAFSLGFRTGEFVEVAASGGIGFDGNRFDFAQVESGADTTYSFEAADIRSIDISYGFGEVQIVPATGDSIEVSVPFSVRRNIIVRDENGTLVVDEQSTGRWFFWTAPRNSILTLAIPENKVYNEFNLEIGAGTVNVIANVESNSMNLTVGAGQIQSRGLLKTQALTVDCGVGQVDLARVDAGRADIKNGVGDVTMGLVGNQNAYNFKIETGIGSVQIGSLSFDGLGQSQEIRNNDSGANINIDNGVGSVNLSFEN
jgi:hypothetical protein